MRHSDIAPALPRRIAVPAADAARAAILPVMLAGGVTFLLTLAAILVRPVDHARGPRAAAIARPTSHLDAIAAPIWIDIVRPFQAFDLTGGDVARLPLRYVAKRDPGSAALRDTLTFGTGTPGDTLFRVTFQRPGVEQSAESSLFVDVARSAAELGRAVVRSGLPSLTTSQFGPLEVAEMTIAAGATQSVCVGFRLATGSKAPLALFGFGCGSRDTPFRAAELACTIDRLDLVSAGDDEPLQAFFARAARQRGMRPSCGRDEAAGNRVAGVKAANLKGSIEE